MCVLFHDVIVDAIRSGCSWNCVIGIAWHRHIDLSVYVNDYAMLVGMWTDLSLWFQRFGYSPCHRYAQSSAKVTNCIDYIWGNLGQSCLFLVWKWWCYTMLSCKIYQNSSLAPSTLASNALQMSLKRWKICKMFRLQLQHANSCKIFFRCSQFAIHLFWKKICARPTQLSM